MITIYKLDIGDHMEYEYYIDSGNCNLSSNIVLGSENCIHDLLSIEINSQLFDTLINNNVRLITPFIPNAYVVKAKRLIENMTKIPIKNLKVTFNDIGMLYECRDLIQSKKIKPVLGRLLTRSFKDCPWYNDLIINENDEVKSAFKRSGFINEDKWFLFSDFNIKEIETNIVEQSDIKYFHNKGIKVSCYFNKEFISISRICFFRKCIDKSCSQGGLCREKIYFEFSEKWRSIQDSSHYNKIQLSSYFEGMYFTGNAVYQQTDNCVDYEQYDFVIRE